jgi:hypothetical protein
MSTNGHRKFDTRVRENLVSVGYVYFGDSAQEVDFTPTSSQAGTMTAVISPFRYEATGSFTLTYTQ